MRTLVALAAALAIGLFAAAPSPATAQYPPATGTVVLAAANPTPSVGERVSIAASVRDATGAPIAGLSCSFSIASQPGDDAALVRETAVSDVNGVATTELDVGSAVGTIVVDSLCGALSGRISVVAGAAVAPSIEAEVPPAQAVPLQLPAAGEGPQGAGEWPSLLLWAGLALLVIAIPGVLYRTFRARG